MTIGERECQERPRRQQEDPDDLKVTTVGGWVAEKSLRIEMYLREIVEQVHLIGCELCAAGQVGHGERERGKRRRDGGTERRSCWPACIESEENVDLGEDVQVV